VNLAEAEPLDHAYRSFDAFFTRRLRIGARPLAEARVTSPSDGLIVAAGDVVGGTSIQVKGRPYEVDELIGSKEDARRYEGGEFAVVYLHPRDYHRVHSPVDGTLVAVRVVPGDLFPVNDIEGDSGSKINHDRWRAVILFGSNRIGQAIRSDCSRLWIIDPHTKHIPGGQFQTL
jgi:phosphatidylserine decarboxylase precursor